MSSTQKKLLLIVCVGSVVIFVAIVFLLLPVRRGQSNGVFCWMEGTVTNISVNGDSIHIQMTGRFRLQQYRGIARTHLSVIEADCKRGISATLTPFRVFIAVTPDGRGGAVRNDKGALLGIIKVAAERGRAVKFELANPIIAFDTDGSITNVESAVVRATDADPH
jgi:hypothetical protein